MKKTFLTMTALVLISPAFQDIAAAGQSKPVIRIARPQIVVKVRTDRLVSKASKDVSQGAPSRAQRSRRTAVAVPTPPAHFPRPRPDLFDEFSDQDNRSAIIDLAGIDPDDLRIGTTPHDPDKIQGGLPWTEGDEESEFGEADVPDEPAGGSPDGFGDDGKRLGIGPELDNPVGDNSHGRDAPETAPGVRVTTETIARAAAGVASDPPTTTPGEQTEARRGVRTTPQTTTTSRSGNETVTKTDDGHGNVTIKTTRIGDGGVSETEDQYLNGGLQTRDIWTARSDGTRTHSYWNYNTGMASVQQTGMQDRTWRFQPERGSHRRRGPIATTWKTDPDSGYGGGWVPPWMEQNQKTLAEVVNGIGPGGLPPAPEHADQGTANNTQQPIISQHDLLANNDPDSQTGGTVSHTPIDSCGKCEY